MENEILKQAAAHDGARVRAMSDGIFTARRSYFGDDIASDAHPEIFGVGDEARLPIGCFLIDVGSRRILVDAGLGPVVDPMPDGMSLRGGDLVRELDSMLRDAKEVTDVVLTHLHADHVGWVFRDDGRPRFPQAVVWVGSHDLDHFIDGRGEMAPHIRAGFRQLPAGDLRPVESRTSVTAHVTLVMTPGHTPGSLTVEVSGGTAPLLLIGDAMTHPVQFEETAWHSFGDVDVARADASRAWIRRRVIEGARVIGSHFPHLEPYSSDP